MGDLDGWFRAGKWADGLVLGLFVVGMRMGLVVVLTLMCWLCMTLPACAARACLVVRRLRACIDCFVSEEYNGFGKTTAIDMN